MNALPSADKRREIEREQTKAIARTLGTATALAYAAAFASRVWAKKKSFI